MSVWKLFKGEKLLAKIEQNDSDFPWLYGEFYPEKSFEEVRVLFDRAAYFNDKEDWESPESEEAFKAIDDLSLRIVDVSRNVEYEHVLLNIDGNEVGWRCYSDKHDD